MRTLLVISETRVATHNCTAEINIVEEVEAVCDGLKKEKW